MPPTSAEIDRALGQIELQMQAVARALAESDATALDAACESLQGHLLALAARSGAPGTRSVEGLSAPARQRLRRCESGLVALRDALARAAAARERGHQILMPAEPHAYGAQGSGIRAGSTGSMIA